MGACPVRITLGVHLPIVNPAHTRPLDSEARRVQWKVALRGEAQAAARVVGLAERSEASPLKRGIPEHLCRARDDGNP